MNYFIDGNNININKKKLGTIKSTKKTEFILFVYFRLYGALIMRK